MKFNFASGLFQERKDREVHLDGVPVYCSSLFIDSGTLVLRFCIFLRAEKFVYKKMPRGIRMETLVKSVCALAYNVVTTTDNFKALTAISPLSESLTSLMLMALDSFVLITNKGDAGACKF